jgi:malonate-semialdehyde dehydrogenase (acetylating)/methylmalonate-semialdehyde dehydrogenase
MFKLQQLIKDRTEDLAQCITREQGKTLADARGDVFRGLEVVELVCGAASLTMGETLEQVASGESSSHYTQPQTVLHEVAGIAFVYRRLDSS